MDSAIDRAERAGFKVAQIALALGEDLQTVANWRKRGVPLNKCAAFEEVTRRKVMRWHMRPEDWHVIWPELRHRKNAPEFEA